MMRQLLEDLRHATRRLVKSPGVSVVIVLTLALGIGANAAVFELARTFLFKPLPVRDPDQLVMLMRTSPGLPTPHASSYPDFLDYRARTDVFSDVAAYRGAPDVVRADDGVRERTMVLWTSPGYFSALGVPLLLGREPNDSAGAAAAGEAGLILSYRYWKNRFRGDPNVVGRTIRVSGQPRPIAGVAPESFYGTLWDVEPSVYFPLTKANLPPWGNELVANRGYVSYTLMGRLRPGVSREQAREALAVVAGDIARQYPTQAGEDFQMLVLPEARTRPSAAVAPIVPRVAAAFAGLALLVLAIGCANVANLMLARTVARHRELAIRAALGAGRGRLVRLMLAESLVLALAAGATAIVAAHWAVGLLSAWQPPSDIPLRTDRGYGWQIPAFAFGLALLAGVVSGLWPTWKSSGVTLASAVREGGAALAAAQRRLFGRALIAAQVAVTAALLVGAGLLVTSAHRLSQVDPGFRAERLIKASIDINLEGYYPPERGRAFQARLLENVRHAPGVEAASISNVVPFEGPFPARHLLPEEVTDVAASEQPMVPYSSITTGYLRTMGIPLLRGRDFDDADTTPSAPVALINETLAQQAWPGQDPLGKRFRFSAKDGVPVTVVGVVGNARRTWLSAAPAPQFFVPMTQQYCQGYCEEFTLFVRTGHDPASMVATIRRAVAEVDANAPVYGVAGMENHLKQSALGRWPADVGATLAALQGILGLALALVGVYSVVAYATTRRTREIGIRVALGARAANVVTLVMRDGLLAPIVGVLVGTLGALYLSRFLEPLLFGVTVGEPRVFAAVAVLLVSTSAAACYWPARRAAKVDPMVALRVE
jgi:putative ABC transport system permease protein